MAEEGLFWCMLAVVASALGVGALAGQTVRVLHSLIVCGIWALLASGVVVILADLSRIFELQLIAGVATFLFSLMIGCAAALVTQRIRRERRMKG